jgi:hypothetical protein
VQVLRQGVIPSTALPKSKRKILFNVNSPWTRGTVVRNPIRLTVYSLAVLSHLDHFS